MRLIKIIRSYSVALSFLTLALPAWAQNSESLGVRCEIRRYDQSIVQFAKTSAGPWVTAEQVFRSGNSTYLLKVEASQRQNGWGVLQLKNIETGEATRSYGPVETRNVFRLNHKDISILCNHWPYIAG